MLASGKYRNAQAPLQTYVPFNSEHGSARIVGLEK